MKAFVVPIFLPNAGCPTRCVFCEQPRITAEAPGVPSPDTVTRVLRQAVRSRKYKGPEGAQVAFYGGTFTGLGLKKMVQLLEAVKPFIDKRYFDSIRLSTRPDLLAPEKIEIMKSYMVKTVELGAQSMDDQVLTASNRGHSAKDTIEAVKRLRMTGLSVGIQLMPGLPMETRESFTQTVARTIELKPEFVRLYPTVVIEGTKLAEMFRSGVYKPLELEEAVQMCAEAVACFEEQGISVIRIGLMSSPSLLKEGQVLAGPWHPSLGDLVRARVYQDKIIRRASKGLKGKEIFLRVNPRDLCFLEGHGRKGIRRLEKTTGARVISVSADASVHQSDIRISCR